MIYRLNFWVIVLLCVCISCLHDDGLNMPEYGNTPLSLFLHNQNGEIYRPFLVDDSLIHVICPNQTDLSDLKVGFSNMGDKVIIDNNEVQSEAYNGDFSDFLSPKFITIQPKIGLCKTYKIVMYDLPVLMITTPDSLPITSKDVRTEGCKAVLVDSKGVMKDLGEAQIKGRGNSTWLQPKKPYNLKLVSKQKLLGMAESKHWTLLANAYYDRTQLHNDVAFKIARSTDSKWAPSGEFVELILNGKHQGLYYLCEKPRVEKNRININIVKESDTDYIDITGGYFLESACGMDIDGKQQFFYTDYFNKTGKNLSTGELFYYPLGWVVEKPNNIQDVQFKYIKDAMNYMESLIYEDDSLKTGKYRDYFDLETAINWKLVEDLCLNEEASRTKNVNLYKKRFDKKFYVAPPWDFDAWTFGVQITKKMHTSTTTLYYYQSLKDDVFVKRLKEKWQHICLSGSLKYQTILTSVPMRYIVLHYGMK